MGSSKETENSQMRRHDQPEARPNDNDLVDSLRKGTLEKGVNADRKEGEKPSLPADGSPRVQWSESDHDESHVAVENAKENPQSPVSVSAPPSGPEFSQHATTALKEESDGLQLRQSPPPESCQGGGIITLKPDDTLPQIQIQSPIAAGLLTPQSNQVTLAYSVGSLDKLQPRRHPETVVQSNQGSGVPSSMITPEKPSEDGYNWRKYGQKFVKGNEFIRSYYKCTYPNCLAKKQVERSNTGPITDINYLGNHEHPQPQHILVQPLQAINHDTTPIEADEPFSAHGVTLSQSESAEVTMPLAIRAGDSVGGGIFIARDEVDNNTGPEVKRQKKEREICAEDDPILPSKNCTEVRHVVQTMSEVDLVNDGYRWRKYGQKIVKGNPNPRSYYRCSNAGCPVKKHVERASHDRKLVITTYEGQHDHDMPASRTLTPNTSSSAMTGGESRSSETGETTPNNALDMVVHISAN